MTPAIAKTTNTRDANTHRLIQRRLDVRRRAAGALCAAVLLTNLAGCAVPPAAPRIPISDTGPWSGRLTLTVEAEPPQRFYAGFTLEGDAGMGQLALTSPLGNTLAVLRWEPGNTELIRGSQIETYDSFDDLAVRATGTPIPMPALFDWLRGQNAAIDGWQADLSMLAQGRLTAQRLHPAPTVQLRVVLNRAQ